MGGLRKPRNRILCGDIAGRVEALGVGVARLEEGDEVYGVGRGGLAEWVLAKEVNLVKKPGNVGFAEAAAVPVAGITALQGLRKGGIKVGQKVLVYGSSGGVGTFAVQIAKSFGAEVTAVCNTDHLDAARSMGADHVVDYTRDDVMKDGQTYDLILAVNGFRSIFALRRALAPRGVYVFVGSSKLWRALLMNLILGPLISRLGKRKMGFMGAKIKQEDLQYLAGLLESGKVNPLISKSYPLNEAADAFRQVGEGHAGGKVIARVSD